MKNNNRCSRLQLSALAIAGLFYSLAASAATAYIEPDYFSSGTDIRTSYPGVVLSVQGRLDSGVFAVDGYDVFNNRNLATTGTMVFGNTPVPSSIPSGKVWDEGIFGLLRADFSQTTNYVQIDLLFDDDDTGGLWAYDASGNLLESVFAMGDGRGASGGICPPFCDPTARIFISRQQNDIAYITAGGIYGEALFLDNLQFNVAPVPIPAAFWLFGSGLIGMLGFMRRRKS